VLEAIRLDAALVLDADALTILASDDEVRAAVRARTEPTLLTPHAGELARVTGREVGADRIAAARALAVDLGVVVLLKGSSTVVAGPEGSAYVALSAPAELATAGSGDVLGGLVGSLLAHHAARGPLDLDDVARLAAVAAHVHGAAGALAASGGATVTAVDVAQALPAAIARIRTALDT
jgi:NAD(P)H-hydrate repair Nnr-like enzyme with NAD(P)H-hydrate dehydratase domain